MGVPGRFFLHPHPFSGNAVVVALSASAMRQQCSSQLFAYLRNHGIGCAEVGGVVCLPAWLGGTVLASWHPAAHRCHSVVAAEDSPNKVISAHRRCASLVMCDL
jgi:hypothetical protein